MGWRSTRCLSLEGQEKEAGDLCGTVEERAEDYWGELAFEADSCHTQALLFPGCHHEASVDLPPGGTLGGTSFVQNLAHVKPTVPLSFHLTG